MEVPKVTRVAVAEVNLSRENKKPAKGIDGISLLNNFAFEQDGIRAWKAYGIGPGKFFASRQDNQESTDLTIVCLFQMTPKEKGTLRASTSKPSDTRQVFSCREEGCIHIFTFHIFRNPWTRFGDGTCRLCEHSPHHTKLICWLCHRRPFLLFIHITKHPSAFIIDSDDIMKGCHAQWR